jgi:hypothetical protein
MKAECRHTSIRTNKQNKPTKKGSEARGKMGLKHEQRHTHTHNKKMTLAEIRQLRMALDGSADTAHEPPRRGKHHHKQPHREKKKID